MAGLASKHVASVVLAGICSGHHFGAGRNACSLDRCVAVSVRRSRRRNDHHANPSPQAERRSKQDVADEFAKRLHASERS